ncbi:MAG: hypothetical protein WAV28_14405 [Sedimentisphaerales bacterium]
MHRKKTEVGGQKTEDGRQVIRLSKNQGGGYQDSRGAGKGTEDRGQKIEGRRKREKMRAGSGSHCQPFR